MVMELYDSQYLLILAPSLVIALMFLFFWLFMKETSYDEVLARQKRDHRLPAAKPDTRKKGEKKKSKKKEGGGAAGSGGGGESEEDPRELDLADVVADSPPEEEVPALAPPAPAPVEPPSGLRERKKKEKKQQQQQQQAAAAPTRAVPPAVPEEPVPAREVNGSKHTPRKSEPALAVTKQLSPPLAEPTGKKKGSQKRQKNEPGADELQLEIKVEQAPPLVKKEAPVTTEVKIQESAAVHTSTAVATASATSATTSTTPATVVASGGGSKKRTSAKKQKTEAVPALADEPSSQSPGLVPLDSDLVAPANPQKGHHEDAPTPKVNAKKLKNEANKENSEVKLRDFLAALRGLVLSEEEVVSVATMLREKNPAALDAWHRSTVKADPSAQKLQEKERLISTLQEEASIAKEKVKQLSQELQAEKQKMGRVEARLREQRSNMEEQQSVLQASFQMKYQQAREQLEGQIARLQQENNILRDAVSTGESKQSSELNQLRGECTRLMKELSEANGKNQQEERQRKNLEVSYKQNISQLESQLQDAKRGWEELQGFLHSVNAEREKLQANKQELQNQLLSAESEISGKNKEIQSLHSSLTDMMVSKEQLEQRLVQLLEVSQHAQPDDSVQDLLAENKSLQVQVESLQSQISAQTTTALHFEELQKLLAEKELQRKSLEDSLNAERSSGASRETDMQALHSENMTLKAEVQKLQAQMSEQTSSHLDQYQKSLLEKDEKIKTVEGLLESGLIQVANKEEELKVLQEENDTLRRNVEVLQQQKEQTPSESMLEELHRVVQEKEEKLKLAEAKLQVELENMLSKEIAIQALEQQVEALRVEVDRARQQGAEEAESSSIHLRELQSLLASRDEEVQTLRGSLEKEVREAADKGRQIQALQEEQVALKGVLEEQQVKRAEPGPELLAALAEKDTEVAEVQHELEELKASLELQRKKNNELREKNWSAMEALSATESMLQGRLNRTAQDSQKAVEMVEAECRDVLHRLLPHVPLPTNRSHKEWLCKFEAAAQEAAATEPSPISESEDLKVLEEKLKESEEAQKLLLKDCETYKKVLAETEGILQRLQSSVEQEESRWRLKLEVSQSDLKEMRLKVATLESELDRLNLECAELDNMRREKQQLESELERAERESATYVTEVRELKDLLTELQSKLDGSYTEAVRQNEELTLLKTQLTETLFKLETEESERQKVAGDLYKAQQSLDLIQAEILKEMGQTDLIENSTNATQMEDGSRHEKTTAGLNETVRELQQLLCAVNRKLTKDEEGNEETKPEL